MTESNEQKIEVAADAAQKQIELNTAYAKISELERMNKWITAQHQKAESTLNWYRTRTRNLEKQVDQNLNKNLYVREG